MSIDNPGDERQLADSLPTQSHDDLLAISAAIRDMKNRDRGVSAHDFIEDLRKRYDLLAAKYQIE